MNSSFLKKIGLLILLVCLGVTPVFGQSILIFSTSHSNTGPTEVKNADGVLKIQISTFSQIYEIRINDETQSFQGKTSAQLDFPLKLSMGRNEFMVAVKTEKTEESKTFAINRVEETAAPGKAKKPFQLIVVGKVEQNSNVTSVKDDPEADTKIGLILIPQYRLSMSSSSHLQFQGIILREQYSDTDLESPQIEYNQLGASYINKAGFGDWQVDAGYSNIGSTTAADATREEIETGMYVGGVIRPAALDNRNVSLGGKYTLISAPDPESPETDAHDGDGGSLEINAGWKKKIAAMNLQINGAYIMTDTKGKYKDNTATSLGAKGDYSLNKKLTLGGQLKMKQTAYAESDPLKGDKEASSLTTITVSGSYQLPIKGLISQAAVTQKTQSSNIESKEYSALLMGVSVIYAIF